MEGVEMRDFAVEAAPQRAVESWTAHEAQDDGHVHGYAQHVKTELSAVKRFWTTHVRITIGEMECREHLALERTFLAYIRTASSFAQFGVAIAQLFRLNTDSANAITSTTLRVGKALGATTEGVAILVLLCGAVYFAKQQSGLMKGVIVGRGYETWIMLIASLLLLCILLALLAAVNHW